jgi:formate/nitrite transporter FocA (FNT family)
MLAVIGNVLAGACVVSLFTATLRLTKPRNRG